VIRKGTRLSGDAPAPQAFAAKKKRSSRTPTHKQQAVVSRGAPEHRMRRRTPEGNRFVGKQQQQQPQQQQQHQQQPWQQ